MEVGGVSQILLRQSLLFTKVSYDRSELSREARCHSLTQSGIADNNATDNAQRCFDEIPSESRKQAPGDTSFGRKAS